jgi:hypothetical protein
MNCSHASWCVHGCLVSFQRCGRFTSQPGRNVISAARRPMSGPASGRGSRY